VHSNETRKLVTGTIPLTGALGDKLGLDKLGHLEPDIVVPYLRQHLHWRIQKHDNTPIERKDIPSLKISVGHALVEVPQTAAEFPSWGKIELSLGVTTGRLGGANEAD
jgi:tyrosinase